MHDRKWVELTSAGETHGDWGEMWRDGVVEERAGRRRHTGHATGACHRQEQTEGVHHLHLLAVNDAPAGGTSSTIR